MPHRLRPQGGEPLVIPRSQHRISRKDIDPEAVKVLYRLHNSGYAAYLVGGGVRDLLLGVKPQDFDLCTDAHPNQVKTLFGNCRLIGRRFRLAHVHFKGGNIIEVATFRRQSEFGEGEGPVVSDNTFGTAAEDAFRRDFTLNALFYDIGTFSIIDYIGGMADISARLVRCIGDPTVRFREDPIRILRAVRMAAAVGFHLEDNTRRAMVDLRDHIWMAAIPRIYEEVLRMFTRGAAEPSFLLLHRLGILEVILPELEDHVRVVGPGPYRQVLQHLDSVCRSGREVTPSLLMAALHHPLFDGRMARSAAPHPLDALREVLDPTSRRLHVPRKAVDGARQLLAAQGRFWQLGDPRGKPRAFASRPYFEEALTLFEVTAGYTPQGARILSDWAAVAAGQPVAIAPRPQPTGTPPRAPGAPRVEGEGHKRKRKRRRGRRPGSAPAKQ